MNPKNLIIILIVTQMIFFANIIPEETTAKKNKNLEELYFNFMNKFLVGSPTWTYHIIYKPDGYVSATAGVKGNVTLSIIKINATRHDDFYLKFIVTRGFFESYGKDMPTSFMEKLKSFNQEINTTEELIHNIYTISPEYAHFTKNMTNLTININFTVYGWGDDIGIIIVARPSNGSLWVPVGGIPLKVKGGNILTQNGPYIFTSSTIIGVAIFTYLIKTRYFVKYSKRNKEKNK